VAAVSKRQNRFLVSVSLLNLVNRYKSWTGTTGGSAHDPIYIQLEIRDKSLQVLLNCLEGNFQELVRREWKHLEIDSGVTIGRHIAEALKIVKSKVMAWAAERHKNRDKIFGPCINLYLNL
jgi:hypothetical protein